MIKNKYKQNFFLIMSIFLIVISLFFKDIINMDNQIHTIIGTILPLLALIIGIISLIHYYTNKIEQLFLFVGAGFIGIFFLEFYHTIVTSNYFNNLFINNQESSIIWSWFSTIIFLSLIFSYGYFYNYKKNNIINDKYIYIIVILFTLLSFFIFRYISTTQIYFIDKIEKLLPAIFLIYPLIGFYKQKNWITKDFEYWIIISIIISLISQIFFIYKFETIFDFNFTIAHFLKLLIYISILIGLLQSIYNLFIKEKELSLSFELTNKKLNAIIESSSGFIWEIDENMKYTYISNGVKNLMGYSPDELIGKNRLETVASDGKEEIITKMKKIFTMKNKIKDFTNWNYSKNGKKICLLSNGVPRFNINGVFIGYRGTDKDVTSLEEDKRDIENFNEILQKRIDKEVQKNREKDKIMFQQARLIAMGEMISMIAHQWRQPISTISMEANNLLTDIELQIMDEEEIKNIANILIQQTRHLSATIDDFKDFFRPKQEKSIANINNIVDETLKVIGKSLEYHNIQVIKNYYSQIKIEIFAKELLHVLLNIIQNSKDAFIEKNIKDKIINITTKDEKQNVIIIIEDNAGGIDQNIIYKIFEPYFSTKQEKNGTGLGLYMSKTIIENHFHGYINVKNIDNGISFTIKIPKK